MRDVHVGHFTNLVHTIYLWPFAIYRFSS